MLWDVEGRQELDRQVMEGSVGDTLVKFRRDGKLVAASADAIQLWNTADNKLASEAVVRYGQGGGGKPTDLVLSPDGKLVALILSLSDTRGSSTIVWELQEGRLLRPPFLSIEKPAVAAMFIDDGKRLLLTYADRTSSTQDLAQELNWESVICNLANQNMEWTEWQESLGSDEPYSRICPKAPLPQSVIEAASKSAGPYLDKDQDVSTAREKIDRWLGQNPKLGLATDTVLAQGLIGRGKGLAEHSNYEGALRLWRRALQIDPSARIAPALDIGKYVTDTNQSSVEMALQFLRQVVELQPGAQLDPERAVSWELMNLASKDVDKGQYEKALAVVNQAAKLNPQIAVFRGWSGVYFGLCSGGVLSGLVEKVYPACEKSVELDPDDAIIRSMRGVARALRGEYTAAIEDFEYYVEASKAPDSKLINADWRERWITELRAGSNPFDGATLEQIKNEAK